MSSNEKDIDDETHALLGKEDSVESKGLRNRAHQPEEGDRPVPQGRAVAMKMFAAFAEAEKITGVPAVLPDDEPGSANWVRAETYWRQRHKNKTKQTIKNKVEAVCWLIAAAAVLNATDFFRVMWRDPKVDRFFLHIALCGTLVIAVVMAYLILYVGFFLGVDWQRVYSCSPKSPFASHPQKTTIGRVIVAGSISLVVCMVSFPLAFWPVWTWWTIPILIVLHMGALMALHFVPSL